MTDELRAACERLRRYQAASDAGDVAAMKTESAWYLWSPTAQTVVVTPEQMLTLDEAAEQIAALAAKGEAGPC